MPKRWCDEEVYEQEWETITIIKNKTDKQNNISLFIPNEISFGSQIACSRSKHHHTQNSFAQSMGVKLIVVQQWESNVLIPNKSQLVKINRILHTNLKRHSQQ